MHFLKIHVKPYCRGMPQNRGMGKVAHQQARAREIARNYNKGNNWYKGMAADLWDTKSQTDSSLTRRENAQLKRDYWRNFIR